MEQYFQGTQENSVSKRFYIQSNLPSNTKAGGKVLNQSE
jgi:hypothetical protein